MPSVGESHPSATALSSREHPLLFGNFFSNQVREAAIGSEEVTPVPLYTFKESLTDQYAATVEPFVKSHPPASKERDADIIDNRFYFTGASQRFPKRNI